MKRSDTLKHALLDGDFLRWFAAAGGGFDPLHSATLSRAELFDRYMLPPSAWLKLDHVYCTKTAGDNAGKPMSDQDIAIGLTIRNIQINKICDFYERYGNRL